jgi:Transposase DDE domain
MLPWWDVEDLRSWPQVKTPMRVIRSQETYSVRRQASQQVESLTTEWIGATTLPVAQAPTEQIVTLGHRRWDIENYGFNELANEWHSDHVYKHDPKALESFLLIAFLACNLFHAFWLLNLKPEIRHGRTQRYWARLLALRTLLGQLLCRRLISLIP